MPVTEPWQFHNISLSENSFCHLHVVAVSNRKEQHGKHQDRDGVGNYCATVVISLTLLIYCNKIAI